MERRCNFGDGGKDIEYGLRRARNGGREKRQLDVHRFFAPWLSCSESSSSQARPGLHRVQKR